MTAQKNQPRTVLGNGATAEAAAMRDVLGAVRQVSAHAAKVSARSVARQRMYDVRDVARDLERLAGIVERHGIDGNRLRDAAAHYGRVASNAESALRTR